MTSTDQRPVIEPVTRPEAIEKLNGLVNALLGAPFLGKRLGTRLMTLDFSGRRTGRAYRLPVGRQELLGKLSVLTKRAWRVNFRGGNPARLRIEGDWRNARGVLVEDTATIARAYAEGIERYGRKNAKNTLGIKVNVDREPTRAEVEDFVSTYKWFLIQFELADGADPE